MKFQSQTINSTQWKESFEKTPFWNLSPYLLFMRQYIFRWKLDTFEIVLIHLQFVGVFLSIYYSNFMKFLFKKMCFFVQKCVSLMVLRKYLCYRINISQHIFYENILKSLKERSKPSEWSKIYHFCQ